MLRYWMFRFIQWLTLTLPLSCSYGIACFLGDMQYTFSAKDRQAVINNLRAILGRDDVEAEAREVFRNFGRYIVDLCRMVKHVNQQFIEEEVDVVGLEHFQEALNRGKGVILATAHMGNWELAGAILSRMGYSFHAIALPHSASQLNQWFNEQREQCGIQTIPTRSAMRRCLQILKENKIIAVVADRDFTQNGVVMPFLGRDWKMPKGPALFAYKTGAAIVPGFLVKQNNGRWLMELYAPICADKKIENQITDFDMMQLMKQYLAPVEDIIRRYPTQWIMLREFGRDV